MMQHNPFRLGSAPTPDLSGAISSLTSRAKGFAEQAMQTSQQAQQTQQPSRQLASNQSASFGAGSNLSPERIAQLRALGFNDNVPLQLIGSESGGNWKAENDETGHGGLKGHFGLMQFGHARLQDAINAGALPRGMTPEQFMASVPDQVNAINWHFNDIDSRIRANGLDQYLNHTIGGVPMTMMAMRAQAHLGGFGGLNKFLNTGGAYNPSDANGTSLQKYGRMITG